MTPKINNPLVAIIMGSKSDWDTMKNASDILEKFDVPHECKIVSAHRTPLLLAEFAASAESRAPLTADEEQALQTYLKVVLEDSDTR